MSLYTCASTPPTPPPQGEYTGGDRDVTLRRLCPTGGYNRVGSSASPLTQVRRVIVDVDVTHGGLAFSSYKGEEPKYRQLVADHGPGPERFQRRHPYNQLYIADYH